MLHRSAWLGLDVDWGRTRVVPSLPCGGGISCWRAEENVCLAFLLAHRLSEWVSPLLCGCETLCFTPPERSHTPQTALKCTCAWVCELSLWLGLSCFCVLWNRLLFLMCPFFCFEVYGPLNTCVLCVFWVCFWCFYSKFKLFCTLIGNFLEISSVGSLVCTSIHLK